MTDDNTLKAVITEALKSAEVELTEYRWPVIVRKGNNDLGKCVRYILNYSAEEQKVSYHGKNGTELLSGESVQDGESITVLPWNVKIVEEAQNIDNVKHREIFLIDLPVFYIAFKS